MNNITRVSLVANGLCKYVVLHVSRGGINSKSYYADKHTHARLVRFFLDWLARQPGAQRRDMGGVLVGRNGWRGDGGMIIDREKIAALCHEQWTGWMEYLFSKATHMGDDIVFAPYFTEHWKRQMRTDYKDLSEAEKDSDRIEADKFIELFAKMTGKESNDD